MSKSIVSPVSRFPGRVVLSDPLTLVQTLAWEAAIDEVQNLENPTERKAFMALLPAICDFVEKWELEGMPDEVTPENFPGTPVKATAELVAWLIEEISKLFQDADTVPNAS